MAGDNISHEDLLTYYEELRRQGNPFVDEIKPEMPLLPPEGIKKYTRAAVRGASLGILNTQDPQDLGTAVTEFVAGIPSTMLATGALAPVVTAGRLARLAPLTRQLITSAAIGETVGATKSVITGDPTHAVVDPLWWMFGDLAGHGIGRAYTKLKPAPLKNVAEEFVEETIPFGPRNIMKPPRGVVPEGAEVTGVYSTFDEQGNRIFVGGAGGGEIQGPPRPLVPGSEGVLGPPSPFTGPRPLLKPPTEPTKGLSPFVSGSPTMMQPEVPTLGPPRPKIIPSTPEQVGQAERNIQGIRAQQEVENLLSPTIAEPTLADKYPRLPEPKGFVREDLSGGPRPKFVQSAGRLRSMDEFGIETVDYGKLRSMDEFGIEALNDHPNIDTFSVSPLEPPTTNRMLKVTTDPNTGLRVYSPVDEVVDSTVKTTQLNLRNVEPSLDGFQRDAMAKAINKARLDVQQAKDAMRTSKLLEMNDAELAKLVDDPEFVTNPHTFFTIKDNVRAKQIKQMMAKAGLVEDDVTEMERSVETAFQKIMKEPINQGLPPEELKRAKEDLWYRALTKRIKPC